MEIHRVGMSLGVRPRRAIDAARRQVASAVNAHPTEVILLAVGWANNLFLKGAAALMKPSTVAIGSTEHPCVTQPAKQLLCQGWVIRQVAVNNFGACDMADYMKALADKPKLISLMAANNETGVVQDIGVLARSGCFNRSWFHSDAVQLFGKSK